MLIDLYDFSVKMDTASSLLNFPSACAPLWFGGCCNFLYWNPSIASSACCSRCLDESTFDTHWLTGFPWACERCGRHEVVLWTTCLLSRSAHRQRGRGAVINGPKSPRSFDVTSQWKMMTPWTSGQMLVKFAIHINLKDMNLTLLQLWKLCIMKPTFQLVLSKEWSNDSKFTVKSRFFPL